MPLDGTLIRTIKPAERWQKAYAEAFQSPDRMSLAPPCDTGR